MNDKSLSDDLLRAFLLGKVNDDERVRIEKLFLTDPFTKEQILAAEEDLIEDYLENALTSHDKEIFLERYAYTETQRRELRVRRSIKDWATSQVAKDQPSEVAVSSWSRLRARLQLRPLILIPITVAAIVAIVVTVVWINNSLDQRRRHAGFESELARLNDPSNNSKDPSNTLTLRLSPISLRSIQPSPGATKQSNVRVFELRLVWTQPERFPNYQAIINKSGDNESFTVQQLRFDSADGAIKLNLPDSALTNGRYTIKVSGVSENGATGPFEEYTLVVSN